jgi:hypothetical protein
LEVGKLGQGPRGNRTWERGPRFGVPGEEAKRLLNCEQRAIDNGFGLGRGGFGQHVKHVDEAELEGGIRRVIDLSKVRGLAE